MELIAVVAALMLVASPEAGATSGLTQRGCMGEIYAKPSQAPELWNEIGTALRRTGIVRPVAAACYRGTGVWTAWVATESVAGEPPLWVVVRRDGSLLKTLCVTSGDDGCRQYWNPPRR